MEKKETFRFGVMGAGNISNKFCDAAEKTEEVCVTAVAARSEERAREFAEKYEIHTYYGNYEEMLQKEKLDGVYIGVVTGMHVQLTELCIRYGIPVLCEKALTGSSEEAERIFKLAEEISSSSGSSTFVIIRTIESAEEGIASIMSGRSSASKPKSNDACCIISRNKDFAFSVP